MLRWSWKGNTKQKNEKPTGRKISTTQINITEIFIMKCAPARLSPITRNESLRNGDSCNGPVEKSHKNRKSNENCTTRNDQMRCYRQQPETRAEFYWLFVVRASCGTKHDHWQLACEKDENQVKSYHRQRPLCNALDRDGTLAAAVTFQPGFNWKRKLYRCQSVALVLLWPCVPQSNSRMGIGERKMEK